MNKERQKRKAEQKAYKERRRIEFMQRLYPLQPSGESRSCGDCQACCHVIAVKDVDKSNYETCKHQCNKGCAIYYSRPKECSIYECMYHTGEIVGNEDMRPDKLGVILDSRPAIGNKTGLGVNCIIFWEVRPGALQEEPVKKLLQRVREMAAVRSFEVGWVEYGKCHPDENGVIQYRFKRSLL